MAAVLPVTAAGAGELPRASAVPGGIAVIELPAAADQAPLAQLDQRRVLTHQSDGKWFAVVGISLDTPPGEHKLQVTLADKTKQDIPFLISDKRYEEQHIEIKDKRKVNPTEKDLIRIKKESTAMNAVFGAWTDKMFGDLDFLVPAQGRRGSPFGLKRFFNGEARNPHSGLDIAADKGTPIHAPSAGKVVLVGDFFFNGNSVFIDHGQGLVSMYCHMSRINVKKGQMVTKGQMIGAVGATGRATGPHLHWSVSLNNTRIDPALFIPEEPTVKDNLQDTQAPQPATNNGSTANEAK